MTLFRSLLAACAGLLLAAAAHAQTLYFSAIPD